MFPTNDAVIADLRWLHIAMLNFVRECGLQPLDYVFFSDKMWFHVSGYINAQNCHPQSLIKLIVHCELSLQPLKVGIWCILSQEKIIGTIFFNQTVDISAEYLNTSLWISSWIYQYAQAAPFVQEWAKGYIQHLL